MRGVRRSLVELVLANNFRSDRHGRLILDERLPEELPVSGGEDAERAWADLVAAQVAYRDSGLPDVYHFAALVRDLHRGLSEGARTSEHDRYHARFLFLLGPVDLYSDSHSPLNAWAKPWTDERLRVEWDEWASAEEWGEDSYAHWRFVVGLEPGEAAGAAQEERERRRIAAQIRRGCELGLPDWDPYYMSIPLEERRRLLREAGRPDLIQPEVWERHGWAQT